MTILDRVITFVLGCVSLVFLLMFLSSVWENRREGWNAKPKEKSR